MSNQELCAWIMRRTNLLKMFPLCEQSFAGNGSEVLHLNIVKCILLRSFVQMSTSLLMKVMRSEPFFIDTLINFLIGHWLECENLLLGQFLNEFL